jgi:hypothetical protein
MRKGRGLLRGLLIVFVPPLPKGEGVRGEDWDYERVTVYCPHAVNSIVTVIV